MLKPLFTREQIAARVAELGEDRAASRRDERRLRRLVVQPAQDIRACLGGGDRPVERRARGDCRGRRGERGAGEHLDLELAAAERVIRAGP